MTASFQAKDPFSKETIQASTNDHHFPGSTLLMKLGQVEYHSKLLLQLAVPNDTVALPRILATAVVASCTSFSTCLLWPRPMTAQMGVCSVVCPRRGGVQHGSWGRGFFRNFGTGVFSSPRNDHVPKRPRESGRTFLIITCQSFAVDEKQKVQKKSLFEARAHFTNQNKEANQRQDGLDRLYRTAGSVPQMWQPGCHQVRIGFRLSSTMTRLAAGSA